MNEFTAGTGWIRLYVTKENYEQCLKVKTHKKKNLRALDFSKRLQE